ncbi:MAG: hypothetical protein A2Z95_04945 [Gallionellales bacterium GWA2_60_18]|nr:MAG: hypothetical protein A2Z95_04945 [Gallionellales bacterium GWA2_60_18]
MSSLLFCSGASAASLSLSIADVVSADLSARGIELVLPRDGSADLHIASLRIREHDLRGVHIHCARFELSTARMSCSGGRSDRFPGLLAEFDYRFDDGSWRVAARLNRVAGKAFAGWLPADVPHPSAGTLDGTVRASGDASGVASFHADVRLAGVGFSDAEGLHAAEGLGGVLKLDVLRQRQKWNWRADVAWNKGELFWQPLYLRAGYRLRASGEAGKGYFKVAQAEAELPEVGRVQLSAWWDAGRGVLRDCTVRGANLKLGGLFSEYAKPFLEKGTLAESSLYGHADVDWRYSDGAARSLRLTLRDAGIADTERRFALLGVNSEIDWRADAARSADITFAGGALLGAPLGEGRWKVEMHGMAFRVAQAVLPVFDGRIELRELKLSRAPEGWRWESGAVLGGISMEQFSRAAGWPGMSGTLAGHIPKVSYAGNEVRADGALEFRVFDGTVVASRLRLADPFGPAPHLYAGINMRGLDLELLTSAFSFGNMRGRIDVDVNDLELQDWRPARFDAHLASSAGSYPKRISQKAVQNISALGGAGAAAAIQRSYLRFFESFGYDRIEWRCVLRNGVCQMGGIGGESGPYTLVKGGGIPAITVMGYNRSVSWDELLQRIKRITQGNMQAVIK